MRHLVWSCTQRLNHMRSFVRFRQHKHGVTTPRITQLEKSCTWRTAEVRTEKPQVRTIPLNNVASKANRLVDTILPLPNIKEEIYAACDTWSAWEVEFPSRAVHRALDILRAMRQWQRVIQVTKWMLSKGYGFSMEIYDLLIRALNAEGRLGEIEEVWNTLVIIREGRVPTKMYGRMIAIYYNRAMPDKALKIFKDMERENIRADPGILKRVGIIYHELGFTKKNVELLERHSPPRRRLACRYREPGVGDALGGRYDVPKSPSFSRFPVKRRSAKAGGTKYSKFKAKYQRFPNKKAFR